MEAKVLPGGMEATSHKNVMSNVVYFSLFLQIQKTGNDCLHCVCLIRVIIGRKVRSKGRNISGVQSREICIPSAGTKNPKCILKLSMIVV